MSYNAVIASGSTNGKPIQVSGIASGSENTIHTAHATDIDIITIYATNTDATTVDLTVAIGTTATEGELIVDAIPIEANTTMMPIIIKHRITGGVTITAFASVTNKINITCDVDRIS